MIAMFNGKPVLGQRGFAGPDGNPIGTVISYMGTSAPEDYLICDGSICNISDYAELAEFFKTQFGSKAYFGGDGSTTFAVPDMRNLFLRGFHGEAAEQLSGEVGVRQAGTDIPNAAGFTNGSNSFYIEGYNGIPTNADTISGNGGVGYVSLSNGNTSKPMTFTSRPVNMAVLYCIKAAVAETYENVFSTEETRIGTWINGKPIYRQVVETTSPKAVNTWTTVYSNSSIDEFISVSGFVQIKTSEIYPVPAVLKGDNEIMVMAQTPDKKINLRTSGTAAVNCPVKMIFEYTKTTD